MPELPDLILIGYDYECYSEPWRVEFSPVPLTYCFDVEITHKGVVMWFGRFCGNPTDQDAGLVVGWCLRGGSGVLPAGFGVPAADA